jgi:arsenate reductase (glutaredoxin)
MQFHPNELFLFYDPHSSIGKQTKAIAMSFCSHLHEVDIVHEKVSPTYWKEIVNMVGVTPDQLLNHSHPDYPAKVANNTYTMNGWLEVLVHDAYMITCPIVIFGGKAVQCQTPTDIYKLKHNPEQKVRPHTKNFQGDH